MAAPSKCHGTAFLATSGALPRTHGLKGGSAGGLFIREKFVILPNIKIVTGRPSYPPPAEIRKQKQFARCCSRLARLSE